jgi:hypothetical protein
VLCVVAIFVPQLAFYVYALVSYPPNLWPNIWPLWLKLTFWIWLAVNFVLTALLRRRMLGNELAEPERSRLARAAALRVSFSLATFWVLAVIFVEVGGVRSKFPLGGNVLSGFFLITFIGLFVGR